MRINREGYGITGWAMLFAASLFVLAMFLGGIFRMPGWGLWVVGTLLAGAVAFVVLFFREPHRTRMADENLVYAPADGTVVVIERVYEGEFLKRDCLQISVFMSLSDVHINWFPVGGTVVYRKYHPGRFLVAWHPKSSDENERMTTAVDTGRAVVVFRQIAGLIARRVVNYAREGARAVQNDKLGFIKFGSRVDVFLPLSSEPLVHLGQKVIGSQTPLAKLGDE